MTLNEFKAWLEGFEASISAQGPTYTQWQVIKEKLATVAPTVQIKEVVKPPALSMPEPIRAWYGQDAGKGLGADFHGDGSVRGIPSGLGAAQQYAYQASQDKFLETDDR